MKKSIKYAGVAAATLLAVAPVAAPVLSSSVTTTVKADATDDNTTAITTAASNYLGGLKANTTVDSTDMPDLSGFFTATGSQAVPFTTYALNTMFTKNTSNGTNISDLKIADNVANVTLSNVSVVTTAGNTRTISNEGDYTKAQNEGIKSITATININSYGTGDSETTITPSPATATVTYSLKDDSTSTTDTIKSGAITYDKSYDVDFGSNVVAPQYSSTTDFSAKDADGNTITTASATPEANYYTTKYDALQVVNGGDAATAEDGVDTTFTKGDTTYYQVVDVAVSDDLATLLDNYKNNNDNKAYTVTANGTDLNSLVSSKDVALTVTPAVPGTEDAEATEGTPATATLKYVREIHVGSEEAANWTVKDETGVVTTKTDKTYYTMKNDDNDTITNRALAANTSWKYDQVRTDADGNVQYRVSTHEWVPAESVTVNDDNNSGSETPEGALTVTNLDTKGVVSLATPGMTYFVYNKEGVMSTTRALAGGSSWLVDKTATDANGNTYYGVSTDEFVKAGEGVSFTA